MSRITHSLVGYDRGSERLAEEFHVPDAVLPKVKELARVADGDPDAIMCYPLNASGAQNFANMLGATIDTERRDYFLEGFAEAAAPYEFADDAKFRPDSLKWSVWIHNDAEKDHIKVSIPRTTFDDYARHHGRKDHCAVIGLINARIRNQVQELINCAIENRRATAGCLELNGHDLAAILDE